jgi:arsenite methyltransferase
MNDSYDDLPLWSAPFGLTLLDTLRYRKNIHVLDIGSGSGFPLLELAERFGETCRIFGIDPADESIEWINRKITLKGIHNAKIIQGFAEELPFTDEYFGLIVSNNGINNTNDDKKVLAECYRVAAPDSQFVLTMNLPYSLIEFYEIFEEVLLELNMSQEILKMKEHISEKRKTVEDWKGKIMKAGFEISTINVDGFRIRYNDGTSFLNHSFIRNAFRQPWENILPQEEISAVFRLIEKKLNRKAKIYGELIMSIPYVCFNSYK